MLFYFKIKRQGDGHRVLPVLGVYGLYHGGAWYVLYRGVPWPNGPVSAPNTCCPPRGRERAPWRWPAIPRFQTASRAVTRIAIVGSRRLKSRFPIKTRALLTGIAALSLATGTVHAEEKLVDSWWTDCRHGWITKQFKPEVMQDNPPVEITDTSVRITYELRKLLKDLPRITRALKACDAYRKCLDDRQAGKVKHSYDDDRRWREFLTGAW